MQRAKQRKADLERDLGRMDYQSPDFFTRGQSALQQSCISFMGRQYLGHLVFQGQMDWRETVIGGIYGLTNLHFPITRRILLQQIARAISYYTGTDPWFAAYDVNLEDTALAEKIERWIRFEADQSDLTSVMNQAIAAAFIQGQAVIKTTHEKKTSYYEKFASIAYDESGKQILALDGDYIFEDDSFVPSPQEAAAQQEALAAGVEPPVSKNMVLKRDLATPQPPSMTFKRTRIQRSMVHSQGAKSAVVHYLDFLCPLTAPDVQSADTVIQIFNEPVISVLQRFLTMEMEGGEDAQQLSTAQQLERLSEMVHALIPGIGQDQLSGSNQSQSALREADNTTGLDTTEPMGAFCEVYMHFDANGDGIQESIVLICDAKCQLPIYYDYVANVTWNGLRPFQVVRVNPIVNRWHGQGQVETFWNIQEAIDLMINRMHQRLTSAGRVDFWNPHLTVEGQNPNNQNLQLNWGQTYTLKDASTDASKVLSSVYLNEINYDKIRNFIELLIQIAINMSGVSNVNDGQMANLDTQKLATGIRNIEDSGNELFAVFIADLRAGVKGTLIDFASVSVLHLDAPRAFKFFEGDVGRLAQITPDEVRDLRLDVEIALTKFRSQQDAAQGQAAWAVAAGFYALPPEAQVYMAPLARNLLKSYQQRNSDEVIQPLTPAPLPLSNGEQSPTPISTV